MDPRAAELPHSTAIQLASTEYQRCIELFRSLQPGDWTRPTDCPDWDVREMACHMLGMLEMAASFRENVRQQRLSMRAGGDPLDALTALQVSERRSWTPTEIVERYALRAPKAVAGRRRLPAFLRGRRMPGNQRVNGADEPWTVGYLSDIILTRDPWMHRIDISTSHRAPAAPDRRPRRRHRGRRGRRVVRSARQGLHAHSRRPGRRNLDGRSERARSASRRDRILPRPVGPARRSQSR